MRDAHAVELFDRPANDPKDEVKQSPDPSQPAGGLCL
jgi:hypothetical protein